MKKGAFTLRSVTEEDCKDMWLWRKHPDSRRYFFDSKPIAWKTHKKWFYSKISDPDTRIHIATLDDNKVGVIRFEIKRKFVSVSVGLNPDFFGRGLGSKTIKI